MEPMNRNNASLRFSISGTAPTNNRTTRIMRSIAVPNPQYLAYISTIRERASKAVEEIGWKIVEKGSAVASLMICWNLGSDIDARTKVPFDALQGIVFENDSLIADMRLRNRLDWNGPRIDFVFREINPPYRSAKARAMAYSDLTADNIREVALATSNVIDPNPGVVRPIIANEASATWRTRAQTTLRKGVA